MSSVSSNHPPIASPAESMALSRTSAKLRRAMRAVATIAFCAIFGATAFVAGVFIHAMGTVPIEQWADLVKVALLFSIAGALFGTILALDRSANIPLPRALKRFEAPVSRVVICACFGFLAVLLLRSWTSPNLPLVWAGIGALIGGTLGWFGWRWAKHVNF